MLGLFKCWNYGEELLYVSNDANKLATKKKDLEVLAERALAFNNDQEKNWKKLRKHYSEEALYLIKQYNAYDEKKPDGLQDSTQLKSHVILKCYQEPLSNILIELNQQMEFELEKYKKHDINSQYENLVIKEVREL